MNEVILKGKSLYPSKIVCVGRNYVEHVEELNNEIPSEPVIFIKPNSAISNQLYINAHHPVHYEAELCFVVESGVIAGVGVGLDLTKRELQTVLKNKGLPWERAKAFDHSVVFTQFVAVPRNLSSLRMTLSINGKSVQHASVDLMMHKPLELLHEVNSFLTLEDGDVLMTGTPKGVGKVNLGDIYSVELSCGDKVLIEKEWPAINYY